MHKIYFNKNLVKDTAWNTFLVPILGIYKYPGKGTLGDEYLFYDRNMLEEWLNNGKKMIEYSDINECDFCVYPRNFYIDFYPELEQEAKKARQHNKKIVVFCDTDIEIPIPYISNMIVYRTSLNSKSPKYEFALPDFVSPVNLNILNHNDDNISIGYCGYGGNPTFKFSIWNKIRNTTFFNKMVGVLVYNKIIDKVLKCFDRFCVEPFIKKNNLAFWLLQFKKGMVVRGKVINKLLNSKYKFNYKKRDGVLNPKIGGIKREEYIENMKKSTFILVARGHGNHAYRLYEAMSTGKIPLFIDTNSRLPLENTIDYRNLFLRVPYKNIDQLDEYIDKYLDEHKAELRKIEENMIYIYIQII